MNTESAICQLRELIQIQLSPLINNDYVLWDLPYHANIGDILIWEGECNFLGNKIYKCLNYASAQTCTFPSLSPDILILLHGGGNFGDVWRESQDFRLKVIKHYPHNRIIVFPQTVFYRTASLTKQDAEIMAEHKHLVLCARDKLSYKFLKSHFRNTVLLVPDMAFCIPVDKLRRWIKQASKKALIVRRIDKEAVNISEFLSSINMSVDIRDWPSLDMPGLWMCGYWKVYRLHFKLKRIYPLAYFQKEIGKFFDWSMYKIIRPYLVKQGVKFVCDYHNVYTTRLHIVILSVLLHKSVTFLDNSYGKNSAFYHSWLEDVEGVFSYTKNRL